MNLYDIIFYLFAAITIVSAIVVVTSKNIIYSAFSLLFTLFSISGLYVLLGADFVAVVQIMVYVGGILILLIFGVMLTNKITSVDIRSGVTNTFPAILAAVLLLTSLIVVFLSTDWIILPKELAKTTTVGIGRLLITEYVLVFELLGILLLVALIGAASIARREKE
ncbi:NADH-quinone oxidoreductase subunit J [Bacteroidota bacterium]